MKKFIRALLFLTFFLGSVFVAANLTKSIFAQNVSPTVTVNQETPEEIARKHGVTFPITDLGGCKNLAECRNFCEDPVNQSVCVDFAKKKGFYKEEKIEQNQEILTAAKTELGCTDFDSCQVACQKEENLSKCDTFAKKHNLGGGEVADPKKQEIIQKAKTILGCDSPDSCRTVCQQETNRQKCDEFAKQSGLRGGEQHVGPGGCTSEATCKAFCSDPNNYQVCSGFSKGEGAKFSGPGGCNSEDSCKNYCQQHAQECKFGGQGQIGGPNGQGHNAQEMCLRSPSCHWDNGSCQCGIYSGGQFDSFCKEHPDQCKPGQGAGSADNEKARDEFEKFCKNNPEKCRPDTSQNTAFPQQNVSGFPQKPPSFGSQGGGGGGSPEDYCKKSPNCSWINNSCQCQGQGGFTPNTTTGGGNPNFQPPHPQQNNTGGSSQNQPPPQPPQSNQQQNRPAEQKPPENKPPEQQKPPENKPPEVKGESTVDLLQLLIQTFANLLKNSN